MSFFSSFFFFCHGRGDQSDFAPLIDRDLSCLNVSTGLIGETFGVSIRENVAKKYNSVERELFSGNTVVHGPFENLLTNFAQA